MIAQLEGQVQWIGEEGLILNVQGVGYLVSGSTSVLRHTHQGASLSLWIETHVREGAIALYGFLTRDDQEVFRLLVGVQGVGARVALNILSTFEASALVGVLQTKNQKALLQAEGVGKRLAERLVVELKDRVDKLVLRWGRGSLKVREEIPSEGYFDTIRQEALDGLTALGYRSSESLPAIDRVMQQNDQKIALEDLIRQALNMLSRAT